MHLGIPSQTEKNIILKYVPSRKKGSVLTDIFMNDNIP